MIAFMRRHARDLKGDLEGAAASALASGSSRALVLMAFLAVLREGFETAVFLLATFDAASDPTASWAGALIGILVAAGVGYAIYRGGVRLNLARFFRITGLVLVLVAAGLVMTAFRTASEAGWLALGQGQPWTWPGWSGRARRCPPCSPGCWGSSPTRPGSRSSPGWPTWCPWRSSWPGRSAGGPASRPPKGARSLSGSHRARD
ncbi:MAG: FTR1 family iron permease [Streptosporangiaceae bacterium]